MVPMPLITPDLVSDDNDDDDDGIQISFCKQTLDTYTSY